MALSAALLLTGCGSKKDSNKSVGDTSGGGNKSDVDSSVSSADKSEGPVDYSKYNSYLDLAEEINGEIEPILAAYFSNVDFSSEFTVTGDYAAIKEAVEFYTPNTYLVEKALGYLDEEPAYPEADDALQSLGNRMGQKRGWESPASLCPMPLRTPPLPDTFCSASRSGLP